MCGFRFLMVVLVACLSLFASCFSDGEYPDDGEHDDQTESNLVMGVEGGPCREDESCDHDLYCSDEMICTREISQVKSDRCPEDGMAFISSHGDVEFYPNVGWRYFFVGVGDDDCNYNWCKFSKPRHRVKIEDGFCLDKKPFTNGDKAKLSQTKAFSDFKWPNKCQDAIFLGDKRPLVCVSWDEANEICRRQGKRLPTEDAWEYAARGMGVRKCQYGTKDCAVPDENNACWQDPQNLSRTGSCDVDRSPPNALDLYDMAGNVNEWTSSYWEPYPGFTGNLEVFPKEKFRVYRGGSWRSNDHQYLRVEYRGLGQPTTYADNIGFRCASRALSEVEGAPQDSKK